jgi:hypothetical protein
MEHIATKVSWQDMLVSAVVSHLTAAAEAGEDSILHAPITQLPHSPGQTAMFISTMESFLCQN